MGPQRQNRFVACTLQSIEIAGHQKGAARFLKACQDFHGNRVFAYVDTWLSEGETQANDPGGREMVALRSWIYRGEPTPVRAALAWTGESGVDAVIVRASAKTDEIMH